MGYSANTACFDIWLGIVGVLHGFSFPFLKLQIANICLWCSVLSSPLCQLGLTKYLQCDAGTLLSFRPWGSICVLRHLAIRSSPCRCVPCHRWSLGRCTLLCAAAELRVYDICLHPLSATETAVVCILCHAGL